MAPKLKILLGVLLVTLTLDQGSKIWVDTSLDFSDRISVIEGFFYLTHVRNPGAAFSLFTEWPAVIRLTFFIGVSLLAIGIIISFFRRLAPGERLSAFALGLILGGAVGNLIDRVLRGEVVDFLHFRLWGGYSWPDFNFADSFIVVGVAFLVLELLASEGESRASAADPPPPSRVTPGASPDGSNSLPSGSGIADS